MISDYDNNIQQYFINSTDELVKTLAIQFQSLLSDTGTPKYLALSMGNIQLKLYKYLSNLNMDWGNHWYFLTDEIYGEPLHPNSNEKQLSENIADNMYQQFVSPLEDIDSPEEAVDRLNIITSTQNINFDLTILNMANDGSVAAIFPGFDIKNNHSFFLSKHNDESEKIISIGLKKILSSKRIILLMAGDYKKQIYQQALAEPNNINIPVSFILNQKTIPIDIYWTVQPPSTG